MDRLLSKLTRLTRRPRRIVLGELRGWGLGPTFANRGRRRRWWVRAAGGLWRNRRTLYGRPRRGPALPSPGTPGETLSNRNRGTAPRRHHVTRREDRSGRRRSATGLTFGTPPAGRVLVKPAVPNCAVLPESPRSMCRPRGGGFPSIPRKIPHIRHA